MISTTLRILQVNLNRSPQATESALQLAIELDISIILVQEPWLIPNKDNIDYSSTRSISHPSFTQILPSTLVARPRTLAYIAREYSSLVTLAEDSPKDSDIQVLSIIEGNTIIQLVNIYNEKDQLGTSTWTINRSLYTRPLDYPMVILGDFNTHHPRWDPLSPQSTSAYELVEWIDQKELVLFNTPGTSTFYRPHMAHPTTIDLTLATPSLARSIEDWQVLPDLGSDHFGILFTIKGTSELLVDKPTRQIQYNTKLANWELFSTTLQSNIKKLTYTPIGQLSQFIDSSQPIDSSQLRYPSSAISRLNTIQATPLDLLDNTKSTYTASLLDQATEELTSAITSAANKAIPVVKLGARPKPWWNSNLKDLRKAMLHAQRAIKHFDTSLIRQYLTAKNLYFSAIKHAKREHWNTFLEKGDSRSIFKALHYTKEGLAPAIPTILGNTTFLGKCSALRDTLFPRPPISASPNWDNYRPDSNWEWPSLTQDELAKACSTNKIKGKTPGPDGISQDIIAQAYRAILDIFFSLYSKLIDIGYHPKGWRQAIGAVLKKPSKPDYTKPKAYRVISLLNCLGKVSERILAQRLGHLAETTTLLHPSQIGGRLQKSANDTALLLVNEIQVNKRLNRYTTALFLDIKGAFDHVAKNQLLIVLKELRLPTSLIAWISSFLVDRLIKLAFNGNIEEFTSIDTGIPQGSPVSPLLFLIYIRDLFPKLSLRIFSYIDDLALIASSTSLKKNIRLLQQQANKIYRLGDQKCIAFDLDKTELIHFTSIKGSREASLVLPNKEILLPKESIKWLGIWFNQNLSFKQHVSIRTSQAKGVYYRLLRLGNAERGLSPHAIRQLYIACITSVADYGAPVWWHGQLGLLKGLQSLQNLACRRILGCFRTSPILPMEVEASLLPPRIRLDQILHLYSIRIQRLAINHPIHTTLASLANLYLANQATPQTRRRPKLYTPTQLEYIASLTSTDTVLEPIKPYQFPPWDRSLPYIVSISSTSKEDTTRTHQLEISAFGPNTLVLYTDGSKLIDKDTKGIGIGVVVFDYSISHSIPIHQYTLNIGLDQEVYNGELEGITSAIEYASSIVLPGVDIIIYSDNQASLKRLSTISNQPGQACQARAIQSTKDALAKGAKSIQLKWVPGHMDILGNELADKLAKQATKIQPIIEELSYATLKARQKAISVDKWLELLNLSKSSSSSQNLYYKHFPWDRPKDRIKLLAKLGTSRVTASAFYQLKLSHGYLRTYLFRQGHSSTDLCQCGAKETTSHLLLSCPIYRAARQALQAKLGSRLTLSLLLNTLTGIEHTLVFLKETRIVTRAWHLERSARREELEGEDID
jgi:ribonuclease HI